MFQKLLNWINRRSIEMEETAKAMGMQYLKKDEINLFEDLRYFNLFKNGRSKRLKHIIYKQHQADLKTYIFDYKYSTGSGDSSKTHKQTVFYIESKALNLPEFYMKPENFFHRIGKFFGKEDINFESHPEFSAQYYLKGHDEEAIRDMMNEDLLYCFTVEDGWSMEGYRDTLLLYRHDESYSKDKILALYERGLSIHHFLVGNPS